MNTTILAIYEHNGHLGHLDLYMYNEQKLDTMYRRNKKE